MAMAHRHRHAPDAAGERAAAEQARPVQYLDRRPFLHAEFAQALGFTKGKTIPIDAVYIGHLARRELMKVQGVSVP